jgi:hypothetical protein
MFLKRLLFLAPLCLLCVRTGAAVADDRSTGAAGQSTGKILTRFDTVDPGWDARLQSLVQIANLGQGAVPLLVEALQNGSPSRREFAAQALGMFNDPRARPALEKAVADAKPTVRVYAVWALRMMGPLEPAAPWEKLRTDPDRGVRSTVAGALDSKDQPGPEALRQAWAGYDLTQRDSARVGELAPDFTLLAHSGQTYRLRDFRGKRDVVLRYFKFDY